MSVLLSYLSSFNLYYIVCNTYSNFTILKSNCIDIAEIDKVQCGYPGITQYECERIEKCCYNGADVFGISCYHPSGRK